MGYKTYMSKRFQFNDQSFSFPLPAGLLWLIVFLLLALRLPAQVQPLPNAHAHNDYLHTKPLMDALSFGFTSIEADIHLLNNELYVVHDTPETVQGLRTLKSLYLEPLRKHIKQNKGYVYPHYTSPVYLMIDMKTEAGPTYALLKQQLSSYKDILYSSANPNGRVQVVLSGNRPVQQVNSEVSALVSIDGRPEDLPAMYSAKFMPIISQNYFKIIRWNGQGSISQEDKLTLEKLAQAVHSQGKKLRLWASPENENVWQVLLEAGVDFINTDKLEQLQLFMQTRKK
jgi:glycerophosphoryl diester phosphodiesterase